MAGEVEPQAEGLRTLHLPNLRKQWQVLTLQIIATIAVIWMYLEVVSTYVVGYIDHTQVFQEMELLLGDELPLGDWLTGRGRTGLSRFYVPIILGVVFGGGMAILAFQSTLVQQRIKFGLTITLIVMLIGRLILSWLPGMLFNFELRGPTDSELETLLWPLSFLFSIIVLFVYLMPVILGTKGIWGLSRRAVAWSIGFTMLFLAVHAILTFPLIKSQLGIYGANLAPLEIQVGDPTIGFLGMNLVTAEQMSLILIAILMLVFQEASFGVIKQLEYAYRLPESCKRDPEYVRQMDNTFNGILVHSVVFLSITIIATMFALGFHSVLLNTVEGITGSQWAGQVSDSIELTLTYGLVISALLFLTFMALMRYLIPWQRVSAWIRDAIERMRTPKPKVVEKKWDESMGPL